MELLLSVAWGSVVLPALLTMGLLVGAWILNPSRVVYRVRKGSWASGRLVLSRACLALCPCVGFAAAHLYFLGWPGFEAFSGMDGLLFSVPMAALFYVVFGQDIKVHFFLGFLGLISLGYILYPLPFLGWMTWLVLCLILFSLSLLARTTTILRSVSGYLSGGVEQKTNRFGEASLWLGYMGTGLILSFLMLMWGSASLAQVLGASLVCLGIFLITIWLIDDSFFFHSLDWLWVFFFWEGVGAYFYLEVPAQFLIPMALPMGLGQMWRAHFRGRANSRHLIILCFVVTAIVLAVGGWAFMSKPKSFY